MLSDFSSKIVNPAMDSEKPDKSGPVLFRSDFSSKIVNPAMDSEKPDKSGPVLFRRRKKKPDDVRLNNLMENALSILEGLQTIPSEINNYIQLPYDSNISNYLKVNHINIHILDILDGKRPEIEEETLEYWAMLLRECF
ncbi:hypothetical protein Glove_346g79 [Diversispora epigaea]|uniref:Uncharacterized protein n=1 Tax=Diversispora epigaea TaxID=1348612 RepID=A0A397HMJ7_9GLOM|nr:hypothetical protein Glove_346g79 [Diversispora epigaea]